MRTYQSKTVDCQPLQMENKIMNNSFATWPPKGLKLLAHSQTKTIGPWQILTVGLSCILRFLKTIVLRNFFEKKSDILILFRCEEEDLVSGFRWLFFGLMSNLNEFRIGKETFFVIDEMIRSKLEAVVVFFEWGYASLKQSLHIA